MIHYILKVCVFCAVCLMVFCSCIVHLFGHICEDIKYILKEEINLDFQSLAQAVVMTHTLAKHKITVTGQLVHNVEWKQMNRWTQPIVIPVLLMRSVKLLQLVCGSAG